MQPDQIVVRENFLLKVLVIRRVRLNPKAKAHREPPRNGKGAIVRLAEGLMLHYLELIERLKRKAQENSLMIRDVWEMGYGEAARSDRR